MNGDKAYDILEREGLDGLETIADELPNGDAYFAFITAFDYVDKGGWSGYPKAVDVLYEALDYADNYDADIIQGALDWLREAWERGDSAKY